MSIVVAIGKWVSLAALILVAPFAVGGVYQSAARFQWRLATFICSIALQTHLRFVATELGERVSFRP
jgi:hypothetical protein